MAMLLSSVMLPSLLSTVVLASILVLPALFFLGGYYLVIKLGNHRDEFSIEHGKYNCHERRKPTTYPMFP
jgi:hypothetical protein